MSDEMMTNTLDVASQSIGSNNWLNQSNWIAKFIYSNSSFIIRTSFYILCIRFNYYELVNLMMIMNDVLFITSHRSHSTYSISYTKKTWHNAAGDSPFHTIIMEGSFQLFFSNCFVINYSFTIYFNYHNHSLMYYLFN